MKSNTVLILLFLLPLFCAAQDSPLQWEAKSKKNSAGSYTITVAATLPEKWHVYADSVADLELGGLDISWDNDKIQKDGKATASPAATIIKDQVFENRELRVYTGNFYTHPKNKYFR